MDVRAGNNYHVGVGVVDADHIKLAAAESLVPRRSDLRRFHVWKLIEGAVVAGNLRRKSADGGCQ